MFIPVAAVNAKVMTDCWKKWMNMTLKLDRVSFLNSIQDSIPFLSRFCREMQMEAQGIGK